MASIYQKEEVPVPVSIQCRFLPFSRILPILAVLTLAIPQAGKAQVTLDRKSGGLNGTPKTRLLDPRSFGFKIGPHATIVIPADQRVLVNYRDELVVARVHAKVGPNYVLLMPDGRLSDRFAKDVQITDRPFEPLKTKALAKSFAAQKRFKDFRTKASTNYVFVYNTSDEFAEVTRNILESMLRGVSKYARRMDFDVHKPKVPLVVIMFRTEAEFQKYQRMPAGVVAYYHSVNNHIVLYEESKLATTNRQLAIKQSLSTIAHEGAHQILHNIGVQSRLSVWPRWVSEGMAEYLAPTSVGNRLKWKGAGEINDMRMFELETELQSRSFRDYDGTTVKDTIGAANLDSTGYAAAWSITHYLAKRDRRRFEEYLRYVAQIEPLRGMVEKSGKPVAENLRQFEAFFGDDYVESEKKLVRHLQKQPYTSPAAALTHYVATIEFRSGRKTLRRGCLFHRKDLAEQWLGEFSKQLDAKQKAESRASIDEFENRNLGSQALSRWLR